MYSVNNEKKKIIAQLIRDEGSKRNRKGMHITYRCTSGKVTIGYGHNIDDNPIPGINSTSELTEEQALRLLETDINTVCGQLRSALPWSASLDTPRFAVLVNMAFNMGLHGLLSFKNTLADVERGEYAGAARRMMQSRWARQVGDGPGGTFDRAERLARQMETGEWQ
ncbi:glycoside hydrolase family protein [Desulfovibrio sp. OttesenSCG-928-I05]|nr:glycoside hydrolase family protein [Desulfovibrio sp. OttesenSCG-928-I05]